jgi:hypothetical protein
MVVISDAWDADFGEPRINCALSPEGNRQAKSTGRAERTRHGIGSAATPGVELIGRLDPRQKPWELKDEAVGRGLAAGIFVQPACLLLRNSHTGDFFRGVSRTQTGPSAH